MGIQKEPYVRWMGICFTQEAQMRWFGKGQSDYLK
jgi:hypothetical protein